MFVAGYGDPAKVLLRDNQYWLYCVPITESSVVQNTELALLTDS